MTQIFNISSAGSTASAWLTVNLNKHRLITALHGLRVNPFGEQLLFPAQMVAGLKNISDCLSTAEYADVNQSGEKTAIGVIHSYYGPEPRDAFLQNGGSFMAIIRDPVMRVNSQFQASYSDLDADGTSRGKVYEVVARTGKLSEVEKVFPDFIRDTTKSLSEAEEMFLTLAEAAIRNDVLNYRHCPENEIIIFEEMVSSEEYCYGRLSALTGIDDQELKQIIAENMSVKTNKHTTQIQTAPSIFDSWPEQFKYLFAAIMHDVGIDTCLGVYSDLGYTETANALETYIEKTPSVPSARIKAAREKNDHEQG